MKYFVGVDGGGTKTAICAASTDNPVPRYVKIGGTSWREHGPEKVARILKEAVNTLMKDDCGYIAGITMGLPCYGESAEGDIALEREVRGAFSGIPIYFSNDVEVGWAGSLALGPGINIVAGTGAIAFGKGIDGNFARCGGWSEFFGDEGSCYWIGRKTIELFSKQSDGRLPRDELYETVRRELNLDDDLNIIDLIHYEYKNSREQIASLQYITMKAAMAGSQSARLLYKEAVEELLLLTLGIRNKLNFFDEVWNVSYTGGLFKVKEFVLPDFRHGIEKNGGKLSTPCYGSVEGAVLLAFQNFAPDGLTKIQEILKEKEHEQL